ncbi:hypothetical protein NDU88_007051 [Pleurodeles waltl]|uniref:Uncharacterized protein n=1 Tax=Pleurodeles waltl TaxID=8319 RepID=A0AAV7NW97_PLEWA|nr:hypothetical protein NDU88_007051 [Pleurodeles waltl]
MRACEVNRTSEDAAIGANTAKAEHCARSEMEGVICVISHLCLDKEESSAHSSLQTEVQELHSIPEAKTRAVMNYSGQGSSVEDLEKIKQKPISLSGDYKLLTKIRAIRVTPVGQALIHQDQCGFVSYWLMASNINLLIHAIDYFLCSQIPAVAIMVDTEKALDLVN